MSSRQSVTFSDGDKAVLRREAARLRISVSELVRRLVSQWGAVIDGQIELSLKGRSHPEATQDRLA